MANRVVNRRMLALIELQPEEAKAEIIRALVAEDGDRELAAQRLGSSMRTLVRWIQILKMYGDIDAAYTARGWPIWRGPERKHT